MLPGMKFTRIGVGPQAELHLAAGDWFNCLWSAASCWIMAAMFVTAWWWPLDLENGRWVKLGVGVLMLEFILIHSGAFLNHVMTQKAGWARDKTLLGLTTCYTLFGGVAPAVTARTAAHCAIMTVLSGRFTSPPT